MPIKNLHKIEQPREKLFKYGPGKLTKTELLAVIFKTGPQGVMKLAENVVNKFQGPSLASAEVKELIKIKGLGRAKACEVAACFELGRRLLKNKPDSLILSPREVWEELKDIRNYKKEHFVIFFLNTQSQEVQREVISLGTLNSSLIHPREVFEPAIKYLASHIIIAHNHPSGSLEPSNADIVVTKRLCAAGALVGIEVIDHIIVTRAGYLSFKAKNLI